jgi:sec-independent protein translocase protein TatA
MIPEGWDWVVIALVFVLLFGAKKLPEMARSLGQSARVFKSEIKGMKADDEARSKGAEQPPALPPAPPTTPAPQPQPQAQAAEGSSGSDTSR